MDRSKDLDLSQSPINFLSRPGWHLQAHLRQRSLLQQGQISWYSSVQSSSTFRYRLAYKPLYIFRFKIIEQGQLSYPKIFPPYFYMLKLIQASIAQDLSGCTLS